MKTDIEVIDGAIELIEADGGWCQGVSCKDAAGRHLLPASRVATRWGWADDAESLHAGQPVTFCLEGAILYAAGWPLNWVWGMPAEQAKQQVAHTVEVKQQIVRLKGLAYRLALQDTTDIPSTWMSLHDFNDDDYTTREDAILVLKRARAHVEGAPRTGGSGCGGIATAFTRWAITRWRELAGVDQPAQIDATEVDYARASVGT
jgi:hypothetical protein